MNLFFYKIVLVGLSISAACASMEPLIEPAEKHDEQLQSIKDQKIDQYMATSRFVHTLKKKEREAFKDALKSLPAWPGRDVIARIEQFQFNLNPYDSQIYLKFYVENYKLLNWQKFLDFGGLSLDFNGSDCLLLKSFIKALKNPKLYEDFKTNIPMELGFLHHYMSGIFEHDLTLAEMKTYYDVLGGKHNIRLTFMFLLRSDRIFPIYMAFKDTPDCQRVMNFFKVFMAMHNSFKFKILPISTDEDRKAFLEFIDDYDENKKQQSILALEPSIYQKFRTEKERKEFVELIEGTYTIKPNMNDFLQCHYTIYLTDLFSIYDEINDHHERRKFITENINNTYGINGQIIKHHLTNIMGKDALDVCLSNHPFIKGKGESFFKEVAYFYENILTGEKNEAILNEAVSYLNQLNLPEEFSFTLFLEIKNNLSERERFLNFFHSVKECKPEIPKIEEYIEVFLNIFEDLPDQAFLDRFIDFLKRISSVFPKYEARSIDQLFKIYANGYEPSFLKYLDLLKDVQYQGKADKFIERDYFRDMRSFATCYAEENRNRFYSLREAARENAFLPPFNPQDPDIKEILKVTYIGAHALEDFYEKDRLILWDWCTQNNYQPTLSDTAVTIFNKDEEIQNHFLSQEIKEFLDFVDQQPIKEATIVKKILGHEKSESGFGSYLARPMYFANSKSPISDEFLSRLLFLIKNVAKDAADHMDLKKSLFLSLLESVEGKDQLLSFNCQTRITGEIFKFLAWHLPNSKLLPMIAGINQPIIQTEDIKQILAEAPLKAEIIFRKIMSMPEGSAYQRLIVDYLERDSKPELFEIYQAVYDDLFTRTPIFDENRSFQGYKKDEHILMRDDFGNLVRPYLCDGTLNPNPPMIYLHAEFQVLEKAFSQLVHREFHQQREVKY